MSTALTKAEHEHQAAHNEQFAASVVAGGDSYLDWAVTGYFYAVELTKDRAGLLRQAYGRSCHGL